MIKRKSPDESPHTHLAALYAILDASEVYEQCPFRDSAGLCIAYGIVVMRIKMLRWRVFVQSDV